MSTRVPTEAKARKALPLCTGVLDYFPDALLAVAELSRIGNDQHQPGEPLHWAKEKSTDEPDALLRHLIDRGKLDVDGVRHSAKVAWRALALLQREIDAEQAMAEKLLPTIPADPDDVWACDREYVPQDAAATDHDERGHKEDVYLAKLRAFGEPGPTIKGSRTGGRFSG